MPSYNKEFVEHKSGLGGRTRAESNGHGPAERVSRKDAAYAKLSPEQRRDHDRYERLEELTRQLRDPGLDQKSPEYYALHAEQRNLREELKAAHPEQAELELKQQADWEYMRKKGAQLADERLAKDTGTLVFTSAADIPPEHVKWVWHHRLPLGTFSLSAGKGGAAKSLHAVWVAAMITLGRLPGCWKGRPRGVLWVTLEASPEKEVVPRLIAAGADLSLVEFATVQTDDDPANDHIKIFNPAHIDGLRKRALKKDIGLIVLDPALDVLDGKVKTNDQIEVRQSLSRIQAFAEELAILILGIAHFNKMNSVNDAIDRITGSAAFSQRVRAAIVFAYNDEDDCFVISQGKNNWGPLRHSNLAFTAEPRTVGDGIETIRLKWSNMDYEHSVGDLLADKHTAASWLVQDGVPLYDVQALLGHEDYATTQRYAHLAPDAHSKVLESWSRRLDAPVTHGRREAGPS